MEMKMNRIGTMFIGLLAISCVARCDEIHFVSGTLNGHILSYGGGGNRGEFVVRLKFGDGKPKRYQIKRPRIKEIDFNDNESNPGSPPDWFTFENKQSSHPSGVSDRGTVTILTPKAPSSSLPTVTDNNPNPLRSCGEDSVDVSDGKGGTETSTGKLISIDEKTGTLTIETKQESTKTKKSIAREKIDKLTLGPC